MALGKIIGKSSTNEFQFLIEGNAKKLQYIKVPCQDKYVLAIINEIEKDSQKTIAFCSIIGYKENNILKKLKYPLEPGTEVFDADNELITKTLGLEKEKDALFIGKLEDRDINVYLNINKLLTRHIAILAKSGAGKCIDYQTKITLKDGSRIEIGKIVDEKLKQNPKKEGSIEFIENNNPNLQVISLNENNKVSYSQIKAFMRRKAPKFMYLLVTKSGQEIKLTQEHPIPTISNRKIRWVPVSKLTKNDYILLPKIQIKGSKQKIDFIELWKDSNKARVNDKKIIELIKSNIKEKKINIKLLAKKLNYSYSTVNGWFNCSGIPIKQLRKISKILGIDFNKIKKNIKIIISNKKDLPSFIEVSKDFAKLMGYMLAEGHNNYKTIGFTNFSKEIQEDYKKLVKKIFKIRTSFIKTKKSLMIYNSFLAQSLKKIGFTNSSWTKFIPKEITKSKKSVIYAFLSSFIDCDGHISKKAPALEISLASKNLVEDLRFIFLRLGIVPRNKKRFVRGKYYERLSISGSNCLKQLNKNLKLLIKNKKIRLNEKSRLYSNTNIDIIPNINQTLKEIKNLLKTNYSMNGTTVLNRCINKKKNPSFNSLKIILENFQKRHDYLKRHIQEIQLMYAKMPSVNEDYALNIIKKANNQGLSFNKIAQNTGISNTTTRSMIRGITKPTNKVYVLAKNSLIHPDNSIDTVLSFDLKNISKKIELLCKSIGYEKKELYQSVNHYKQFLYSYRYRANVPSYSIIYKLTKELFEISQKLEEDLKKAKELIEYLYQLSNSNLFFDQIKSIKKIITKAKYVYDLETKDHNFVANNLLIHNSYSLGVLLEELLEKKVPIVIIDPHGEYSSLKYPNIKEAEKLKKFNMKPTNYTSHIQEFSPNIEDNPEARPFKLNNKDLTSTEFIHLLPAKLSNAQLGLFYSVIKNLNGRIDLNEIITELVNEDNNIKWSLINIIEYLQKLELFSENHTKMYEIVKPGKLSILNLKGINTDIQEIIVYKLVKDLFNERKKGNIPPFFLVIEEGHNYIPERTYGETKSSSILRQAFAEGRKFGLGICIVSQRPSRIEKNALSQVNTQIILNVTNPHDVKAISNSVEGINSESEKEIRNLPVGTAMITGVVDTPIFVNIRTRKTKHGGEAVNIFDKEGELLPLIMPNEDIEDLKLIYKEIKTILIPCLYLTCKDKSLEYNFLINLTNGNLIEDINKPEGTTINFPDLGSLSPQQERIFLIGSLLKEFKPAEIFSKSGMQFSEVYETINNLVKKGYFVKNNNNYSISFNDFFQITKKATFNKVDFKRINYDKILEKKIDTNNITNTLSKFFRITNEKKCYLVKYLKSEQ
jgi:DNA helicase HerA-like ATPase/ribosome-binding protein aMBF1 (putative translation factor)